MFIFGILIFCFNIAFVHAQSAGGVDKKEFFLKTLAETKGRYLGTAVDVKALIREQKYSEVLAQEFNVLTPENAFKFDATEPEQNHFNFKAGDIVADFALSNNMKIRGHTLVWGQALPGWLTEKKYSPEELKEILRKHIRSVAGHYKGKVYCWDVVNEAFEDDGTFRHNIWYDTIGPEYIELAFRWARESDPNALLFYNDAQAEVLNIKSDAIFEFLKKLKSKGVPIDGIGFQAHVDFNFDYIKWMDLNLKRFAALGLETDFTELDVSVAKNQNESTITQEKKIQKQAAVFKNVVKVCLNNPSCKMVVMWGFTDTHIWAKTSNKDEATTIFDAQYLPKPAYHEIKKAFQGL